MAKESIWNRIKSENWQAVWSGALVIMISAVGMLAF